MENNKQLTSDQTREIISVLKSRFEKNMNRHQGMEWSKVETKLTSNIQKLWSLSEMENTGGEPDIVAYDQKADEYVFYDCAADSPKARRSICYDHIALNSRKENKPKNSALNMADEMGIEILNEEQYRALQKLGPFDTKTSSWIKTPDHIRKLGGAIFADFRFDTVFVYHNGAESYYAGRGFRGALRV